MASSLESYLNQDRTTPVDSTQKKLTDIYILPHLSSILFDFQRLREAIDMAVGRFSILHHGCAPQNLDLPNMDPPHIFHGPLFQSIAESHMTQLSRDRLANYPVGQCTTITRLAWQLLEKASALPPTEGFSRLKKFAASGGSLHVIWGGLRNEYFQTAFQAGSYFFDISNDTVDVRKPKLDHSLLEQSGFHDIHSYREYIGIKERYHHTKICGNHCFPMLFPYFPLILSDQNRFFFDTSEYMAKLNITTGFRTLFDAVDDGCLENGLNETALTQIRTSIENPIAGQNVKEWFEFRVMDQNHLRRSLEKAASLSVPEHIERLKTAQKTCKFLNYILMKQNRKPD